MEIETAERYNGRDGLFRALVFIFFLVGSLPGKSVVEVFLDTAPPVGVSVTVFAALILLALAFTGLPIGFAMLPVCALLAGAYVGFLAQKLVSDYAAFGSIDYTALILCALFTPAYFIIAHAGMRCCGMLSMALERCGEWAQTEYTRAFLSIAAASVFAAVVFYLLLRL